MTRTRWIIFALICVVVLGGLVLLSKKDTVDVSGMDPSKVVSETETATASMATCHQKSC